MLDVPRPTFDVLLESSDDAVPTTTIGLMLAHNANGKPIARESRQAIFPGRRTFGDLTTASKDPLTDFTWEQSDWSGGAMQARYNNRFPNKYASSNGVDLRGANVATLGMALSARLGFLIRNPGAEDANTNGWTAVGGATLTAVTTTPRTGTYHFQFATAAAGHIMRQRLGTTNSTALENQHGNPEVYQGRAITIYAYARRSGGTSASARVNIVDSVGTTNGTAVVLTTTYQLISATRTINAAATSLQWEVEVSAAVGTPSVWVDDLFAIPAGGVVCRGFIDGPEELVYNGGAEINSVAQWTAGTGTTTITSVTTAPYNGSSRHFRLVNTNAAEAGATAYQALTSPTTYQSRTVVFTAFIRLAAVVAGTSCNIRITDDAGSTDSSTVAGTTYTAVSVSRVISSTATFVRLTVVATSGAGDTDDAYFDQLQSYTTYDNPAEAHPNYVIIGRTIAKWDETNDVWNAVYIRADLFHTAIIEYNQFIYVATGNGDNAYVYGTGTSWITSNLTGDARFAHFFNVARRALFKTRFDATGIHNFVSSSTNAVNGGSWGAEDSVGSDDRMITGLYTVKDRVVVGKEDSIHALNRVVNDWAAAADWVNVMNDNVSSPSTTNFDRAGEQEGWLYITADQQKVFRFDGRDRLQDISRLFWSPRLTDFGGRIRAFAHCAAGLFFLLDTPTTDTTVTKDVWLMNLNVIGSGENREDYVINSFELVRVGDINVFSVNNYFLWAIGRIYNSDAADYESAIYRWNLPEKTQFPAYDDTPLTRTSGTFDTSIWDGNLPDDDKAFTRLTIFTEPSTLNQTARSIVVSFRVNEASAYTTLATLTGAGASQQAFFDTITTPETNAVGRAIQLRFQLNTENASDRVGDATEPSPALYGFALHGQLRPDRIRVWDMWFEIGAELGNGMADNRQKQAILDNLQTLEQQDYPIRLTADLDLDGDNEISRLSVSIRPGSVVRDWKEETRDGVEVWKVTLVEVVTA